MKRKEGNKFYTSIHFSILSALLVSIGCYMMNNCSNSHWDQLLPFTIMESFLRNVTPSDDTRDDVIFINVHYDPQIIDCLTQDDNLRGKDIITNRDTLLSFLKKAEKTNTYKYIFLDIRFEKGTETSSDTILFNQIAKMRNVSFSKHYGDCILDLIEKNGSVKKKALINDYYITITNTNFTRYSYIQNNEHSVPLSIFESTDTLRRTIEKYGPFYFFDGCLCQNSPYMRISSRFDDYVDDYGKTYYDLGPYLLNNSFFPDEVIGNLLNDKIVFVGDIVSDVHDTYIGEQPGAYLLYLAYKELVKETHVLSLWFIIIMLIVYFFITLSILYDITIWKLFPFLNMINNELVRFLLDLLSFSTVLTIITFVMFVFFHSTYSVFVPSVYFSVLKSIKPLIIHSFKNYFLTLKH